MKVKITAALLAFFLGGFGIHKFYLGEKGGVLRIILTCSIFGAPISWIWAWIEAVILLTMDQAAFDQRYNSPMAPSALAPSSTLQPVMHTSPPNPPEPSNRASIDVPDDNSDEEVELPDGALCFAKGLNGQVTLLNDRVKIERKGGMAFVTYGFRGTKEILISEISSVEYRNAGTIVSGYILFLYRGGRDVRSSVFGDDSITNNENAVMFIPEAQPAFDTLREALNMRLNEYRQPQQVVVQAETSSLDELRKLGELKDSGVLTEEEFEREKARIFGK